jgi:RHS repeat-associated protein
MGQQRGRRSLPCRLTACTAIGLIVSGVTAPAALAANVGHANGPPTTATTVPDWTTFHPSRPAAAPIDIPSPPPAAPAEALLPELWSPRAVALTGAGVDASAGRFLFDGNQRTAVSLAAHARKTVRVELEGSRSLVSLGLAGTGHIAVSAFREDASGSRLPILASASALERGLALSPGRWVSLNAPAPAPTSTLVLELAAGDEGAQVSEIVLWALGPAGEATNTAPIADRLVTETPANAARFDATPREAEVARVTPQGPRAAAFAFKVEREPTLFARTFVVYELERLAHWTAPSRSINGHALRGGFRAKAKGLGGVQVEEISPHWLRRGDNTLTFEPAIGEDGLGYRVRNVRLVGVRTGADAPAASAGANLLQDGNRSSGLGGTGQRTATIPMQADAQPAHFAFFLENPGEGSITLVSRNPKARERGEVSIDLRGRPAGWQSVPVGGALPASAAVKVTVAGGREVRPRLTEARIASYPALGGDDLAIAYPLHGECFDHQAYLRGFVRGGGDLRRASFAVNGELRPGALDADGSFASVVAEPPPARGKPWTLQVSVTTADGARQVRAVPIEGCVESPPARVVGASPPIEDEGAPYGAVVSRGAGRTLAFAGATLQVPAGAVDRDVRVTMRPLGREKVAPLGKLMTNVTPGGGLFRFGPHGLVFKKGVKLTLPVDTTRIPEGLSARDVQTFYYDEAHGRWVSLGGHGEGTGQVAAVTGHFTDFISATIATADSPAAHLFNPNTLKGIKVGDPAAAISLIEPPQADPSGAARLQYPIETPPGRNGIQPALALTYDSERVSGNGWLGVGWDLTLSSLEIDTRFGAPRYDGSETYRLDGVTLVPIATNLYQRRVEGHFDRIERKGTGPTDYHWEVTDKSGTRFTYGANANGTANSRLADARADHQPGNIFRWYLERVDDPFGNFMTVTYVHDTFTNGDTFTQVYPQQIDYTGSSSLASAYQVLFKLDDGGTRPDVIINGRSGFPTATRRRLVEIDVNFAGAPVRAYTFEYDDAHLADTFNKSVLSAVAMRSNPANPATELYRHTFDYFKAPATNAMFAPQTTWGPLQKSDGSARSDDGLHHATNELVGGSGSVGVGFSGIFSATVSAGGDTGNTTPDLLFLDATGDALPDQIQRGGFASFNELLGVDPDAHFVGAPFPGLGSVGHTNRSGWTVGGDIGVLDGLFGAGVSYSQHTAEDDVVMADMNGDGFPDVVTMESGIVTVRLNNGRRQFSAPQPWNAFSLSGVSFTRQDRFDAARQAGAFFSADPLIRWVAPFGGTITIDSTLTRARTGGDGVRADLFVNNESAPRWTCNIGPGDLSPCTNSLNLTVAPGTRVYTKVSAAGDPAFDDLISSIAINYQVDPSLDALFEPYGAPIYHFNQADDFRLAGLPQVPWTATAEGEVLATACFTKNGTADDITASLIHKRGTSIVQQFDHFEAASNTGTFCINQLQNTIHIQAEDKLFFQVTSDAQIDPATVTWPVEVTYQSYCRVDPVTRASVCAPPVCLAGLCTIGPTDPLIDFPLPEGFIHSPTSIFYPAFEWTSDPAAATASFVASSSGTTNLSWSVSTGGQPITVLVQGVNRLFAKAKLDGTNPSASISVNADLQAGEQVFFTAFFPNGNPSGGFSIGTATVGGAVAPTNLRFPDPNLDNNGTLTQARDPMSGGYHRWFYGDWNGSRPFNEAEITVTTTPKVTDSFLFATPAPFGLPSRTDLGTIPMWLGRGSGEYMAAGLVNPGFTTSAAAAGSGAGVNALRVSDTWNVDLEAHATVVSAAINDGDSTTDVDLIDLNGDRYPDSVSAGTVQFNDGVGAFTSRQAIDMALEDFEDVRSTSNGSMRLAVNLGDIGDLINMANSRSKTSRTVATAAVSGATNYGVSSTRVDFLDVNGDGLLDHVAQKPGEGNLRVRLNLGYGFSKQILWTGNGWELDQVPASFLTESSGNIASDVIQEALELVPGDVTNTNAVRWGDTQTNDLSVGVSAGDVFGAGGGPNATLTRKIVDFIDLNGDGLPDQVMRSPDEAKDVFRVKLNLGDHFGPETQWSIPNWTVDNSLPAEQLLAAPDGVGYSTNTGWGANVHFEVCFIVCVGGSAFYQRDNGGSNMEFEDVDGDGKTDQVLKIENDANVYVKLNQTGKTNLLRTVHRPLGGTIAIDYKRVGNHVDHTATPAIDMPSNQWALATVTVDSGQAASQPQPLLHVVDYTTAALGVPAAFSDRAEREGYGFADVKTSFPNEGTSIARQYHNQDYYRKTLPIAVTWNQSDALAQALKRETFTYLDPSGKDPTAQPVRTGTLFPAARDSQTIWLEADPGGQSKRHLEVKTFDTAGNLTDVVDIGDVDLADPADDFNYHIDYVHPDAAGLITRPNAITARTGQTQSGALLRKRTATYFPTGKAETVTDTIAGGKDPATGTPRTEAAPALATSTYTYDGFGNLATAVGPEGHAFSYIYDDTTKTYRTTSTDTTLGYVSTAAYDLRFGLTRQIVDLAGARQETDYDEFGRTVQVFGPNDFGPGGVRTTPSLTFSYSEQPHLATGFVESLPASATTSHKNLAPPEMSRPGDAIPARPPIRTVTHADGLARVIQTKKDITRDDGLGNVADGMTVSGQVIFDSRGRLFQEGQAVFRPATTNFLSDVPMLSPTTFAYDVLSRTRQMTRPDASSVDAAAHGNQAVTTTSFQLGTLDGKLRLLTLVQDPRGEVRSSFRSVRDEIVGVDEVNKIGGVDNVHLVTRFTYDPLGQLVAASDAKENVTTSVYDTLGQTVVLTSPDAGRTEWRYNRAGNATVKETANLRAAGQRINYVYNADRLESIIYPTSTPVTFVFGASSETGPGAGFVAGRVKRRTDESGQADFRYDALGNLAQETTSLVTLRNGPKGLFVNTMEYSYDSFGRMLEMKFPGPGAEVVRYGYDAGGEVTSARGLNTVSKPNKPPLETTYLQHLGYDEHGQRTRQLLGNGIGTQYLYEADTRRLSQVNTDYRDHVQVAQNIGPLPMQRLRYAYDIVGNVRSMQNAVPSQENGASVVVGPTSFAFDYDRLYQLTHVDGTYQNHVAQRLRHSMDLAYDQIGNLTGKDQQDFHDTGGANGTFQPGPARPQTSYLLGYTYGGPRPHAVTHLDEARQGNLTTPRDMSYDANGNQTGWTFRNGTQRVQTWNEEDRLRHVQDQGHVIGQYLYNSTGVRTHSFADGDETTYVSKYVSVKNRMFYTQHIYANDMRIATKVNADSLNNQETLWYHSDHLQSTQYVSVADQTLVQHIEYFASGETWDEQSTSANEPFRPDYFFNAQELDKKTGYYYFGARYYDPQVQNWQSTDPILSSYFRGGGAGASPKNLGLYSYAYNNPVVRRDPTGRQPDGGDGGLELTPPAAPQYGFKPSLPPAPQLSLKGETPMSLGDAAKFGADLVKSGGGLPQLPLPPPTGASQPNPLQLQIPPAPGQPAQPSFISQLLEKPIVSPVEKFSRGALEFLGLGSLLPEEPLFTADDLAEPAADGLKKYLTKQVEVPDKSAGIIKTMVEGFLKSNGQGSYSTGGGASVGGPTGGPIANPALSMPGAAIDQPLPSFPEYIKGPEIKF